MKKSRFRTAAGPEPSEREKRVAMVFSDFKKLTAHARRDGLLPVYFLFGEDEDSVLRAGRALWALCEGPFPDMNRTAYDGRSLPSFNEIADAAGALPFMAERRCVLLDNLNAENLDKSQAEKLWQLLDRLIPETTLIITWRTDPPDIRKSSRAKKLYALCDKAGGVCAFPRPSQSAASRDIRRAAAEQGSAITEPAAALLAEYCGLDTTRIASELGKLCSRLPGGEIGEDLVREMVRPVSDARVFDLADRLLGGDLDAALRTVDNLLYQREDPVQLLSILSMAFVDAYRARAAQAAGVAQEQAARELGYASAFRFSKGARTGRRFSREGLRSVLDILTDADRRAKSSAADTRVILETVMVRIYQHIDGGNL